jgi:hypothetical protein
MKNSITLIFEIVIFACCFFPAIAQEVNRGNLNPAPQVLFTPKNHDPNFLKSGSINIPEKSFYQRKSEWQHIIDSTWGPGDSLDRKLEIFNTYAKAIHDYSDILCRQNLNWDSIYNHYLGQINESTSKGAFSAIMSHFAYDLKNGHTIAFNNSVAETALNPGVPLLKIGSVDKNSFEHFGAVTTVLPDSTTLVLRVAPNHPLNLQPGDIILGYEGIPWKKLATELFNAGLPMVAYSSGWKPSDTYAFLSTAGINWHLFNTIDVLQYSTGDTLHLSVLPLLDLNLPRMANNEQLAVKNIPFPNVLTSGETSTPDTTVTYGILENTNIGYIFLARERPVDLTEIQFYNAVKALKNTEALIIDLRYNIGGKQGITKFDSALNILFNEYHKTVEFVNRCNTNTFDLCNTGYWTEFEINGKYPDYYDRPIAVLLGPACASLGEITAQRLKYHPMVRFFGASTAACYGFAYGYSTYADWNLLFSGADMYHISQPDIYLNRSEFPIDYPVWFNKDDVAKGIDPVVEKSLEWINNLAYGHTLKTEKNAPTSVNDTITINAIVENPNANEVSAILIFERRDGVMVDSVKMFPVDLAVNDSWQCKWITDNLPEDMYWLSLKVTDNTDGTYFTNKHMTQISNVPVWINEITFKKAADNKFTLQTLLESGSKSTIISNLSIKLSSNDNCITSINPEQVSLTGILPGQIKRIPASSVYVDENEFPNYVHLTYTISDNDWRSWVFDTTLYVVPTGVDEIETPISFNLEQNYPNPFNSNTTIPWKLAENSKVTLKVLDIVGRTVDILVDEQRPAGNYETQFNAATLSKGIYFYQLKAGENEQTRKMILFE